jgi:formamidopyrimidine-DNA glycosylase
LPELPEVETVVRELKALEGRIPTKLKVSWHKTPTPGASVLRKALVGKAIRKVDRRGKYILLEMESGDVVSVHLRMTGKLVFEPTPKDRPYIRLSLELDHRDWLHFVDVRKFGRFDLFKSGSSVLPLLGPEPLEVNTTAKVLSNLKSRRELKKILLDQKVLAGVGNIYADEALYMARLSPFLPGVDLAEQEAKVLAKALSKILLASIKNMGTTLSDYRTTKNMGGENQNYLKVYGQTGRPCGVCETPIEREVIGGRSTHYCPVCQKVEKG